MVQHQKRYCNVGRMWESIMCGYIWGCKGKSWGLAKREQTLKGKYRHWQTSLYIAFLVRLHFLHKWEGQEAWQGPIGLAEAQRCCLPVQSGLELQSGITETAESSLGSNTEFLVCSFQIMCGGAPGHYSKLTGAQWEILNPQGKLNNAEHLQKLHELLAQSD